LKDVFRGLFLVPFYGTKLRDSRLVRMVFSSGNPELVRIDADSGVVQPAGVKGQ
jgi:hypothetical protein